MDIKREIAKLFDEKKYDQVILKINDSKDKDLLFIKAMAYAFLNDYDKAISTLKDNEELLNKDLVKLIDTHINICLYFNNVNDALLALQHYEEYPYISQEVEEKYAEYKKEILEFNKRKQSLSVEEIKQLLTSNNDAKIEKALSILPMYRLEIFASYLQDIMLNYKKESIRTLVLILLSENKYAEKVDFNWHGEIISVIPKDIPTLLNDKTYMYCINLAKKSKEVQFIDLFNNILTLYGLYYYPRKISADKNLLYEDICLIIDKMLSNSVDNLKDSDDKLIKEILMILSKF